MICFFYNLNNVLFLQQEFIIIWITYTESNKFQNKTLIKILTQILLHNIKYQNS